MFNNAYKNKNLKIFTLIFQFGPTKSKDDEQYNYCLYCPDATIRNGQLVPICLSDIINPQEGSDLKLSI